MRILRCIDDVDTTILQVDFGGFHTRLAHVTSARDYLKPVSH